VAINSIVTDGTLTEDPVRRQGNGPLSLNLKHEGRLITPRDGGESWRPKHFWKVNIWGDARDQWAHLKEGDYLVIQGEVKNNSWVNDAGERQNNLEIDARQVEAPVSTATPSPAPSPAPTPPPQQYAPAAPAPVTYADDEIPF
jgi:single-stranded DNA-binding protein